MKVLFYVEGKSEEHFVTQYLHSVGERSNISDDIYEFSSSSRKNIYVLNCESDSNVFPAIKKHSQFLKNLVKSNAVFLVVIRDINTEMCYRGFLQEISIFVNKIDSKIELRCINSKPGIETEYFENTENILDTVTSLKQNTYPLVDSDLIKNCKSNQFNDLKKFHRKNDLSFNKARFAEKYFARIFNSKAGHIRISSRLQKIGEILKK